MNSRATQLVRLAIGIRHSTTRAAGLLAVTSIFLAPAGLVFGQTAAATASPARWSSEGFSSSVEDLPEVATTAWLATVLITNPTAAAAPQNAVRSSTNWGSGVVLAIETSEQGARQAVVITNAHVVACSSMSCRPRVAFADSSDGSLTWARSTELVSQNLARDMAVLRVEVPPGVEVSEARLGPYPEATEDRHLVAIGWPDLLQRSHWNVDKPDNRRKRAKRFSHGHLVNVPSRFKLAARLGEAPAELEALLHSADTLPGSSGGPVVDSHGHVVGLNTQILRTSREERNTGEHCFAGGPGADTPCVYLAISSSEIARELAEVLGTDTLPDTFTPASRRSAVRAAGGGLSR